MIAIIAILAAILFPVFARARERARQTSCLSNTKQMAMAVAMFTQDHNELLPKAFFNDVIDGPTGMPWNAGWDVAIYPYIKNTQVYTCPSDSTSPTYVFHAASGGTSPAEGLTFGTSYRYNASNQPRSAWDPLPLSALDQPASAILIAESDPGVAVTNPNGDDFNTLATWDTEKRNFICDAPGDVFTNNIAFDRHAPVAGRSQATYTKSTPENLPGSNAGLSNYVFADGHAKALTWGATWQRIGPDTKTADGALTVTPTMWRQNFVGTDLSASDQCGYKAP